MTKRYFSETPIAGSRAVLVDQEAHHLKNVMRARPGEQITLFDGSGKEFVAAITEIGRSQVQLEVLGAEAVDRELPFQLTLAVALPKGDRSRWLIEKCTELGVTKLVPLITDRGVVQPAGNVLNRLQRAVIEASKQSGRNRLMEVAAPQPWSQLADGDFEQTQRWVAHPEDAAAAAPFAPHGDILIAIGPEGGFTDEEIQLGLAHDWRLLCLGPRILRI